MASSRDGTSPCDLLQGLVAGTNPLVSADLAVPEVETIFDNLHGTRESKDL